MAYLDTSHAFSPRNAVSVEMPEDFAATLTETDSFQPVEWSVISLAQHDSLATLHQTRRSKLGRLLFGQPRTYSLSDERLEALRWLAVEAWHQPLAISLPAIGGFIAAGFTNAQLALLLRTTGAMRALASANGAGQTPLASAAA